MTVAEGLPAMAQEASTASSSAQSYKDQADAVVTEIMEMIAEAEQAENTAEAKQAAEDAEAEQAAAEGFEGQAQSAFESIEGWKESVDAEAAMIETKR